jgi:hypothetical protein
VDLGAATDSFKIIRQNLRSESLLRNHGVAA